MVEAVAIEGAIAAREARADILDRPSSARRFHVERIEIDECFGAGDPMRIVAGRARRPLVHDVETMATVLADVVQGSKTLVAQNARPAVAFVAERIIARAFGSIIRQQALAL